MKFELDAVVLVFAAALLPASPGRNTGADLLHFHEHACAGVSLPHARVLNEGDLTRMASPGLDFVQLGEPRDQAVARGLDERAGVLPAGIVSWNQDKARVLVHAAPNGPRLPVGPNQHRGSAVAPGSRFFNQRGSALCDDAVSTVGVEQNTGMLRVFGGLWRCSLLLLMLVMMMVGVLPISDGLWPDQDKARVHLHATPSGPRLPVDTPTPRAAGGALALPVGSDVPDRVMMALGLASSALTVASLLAAARWCYSRDILVVTAVDEEVGVQHRPEDLVGALPTSDGLRPDQDKVRVHLHAAPGGPRLPVVSFTPRAAEGALARPVGSDVPDRVMIARELVIRARAVASLLAAAHRRCSRDDLVVTAVEDEVGAQHRLEGHRRRLTHLLAYSVDDAATGGLSAAAAIAS